MITKLDDAVSHMEKSDRPALAKAPPQPLSVEDAIALMRPQPINKTQEFCPLDATMYGLSFDVKGNDGSIQHINPDGPKARIKLDDKTLGSQIGPEAKEQMLTQLVKAVIANEQSWDVETCWAYAKTGLSLHLDYSTVVAFAKKYLDALAESGAIKIINNLFTNQTTYGK